MIKAWLKPHWRSSLFLAAANATWMIVAWVGFERESWLWIIPIALSINFLLLTYDQVLHFKPFAGHPIIGSDSWGLLKIVNELAEEMRVPAPKVFIIPRHSAQIFSYAKTQGASRLFVTQGLLELLTPRQLRAVLIYQMISIRTHFPVLNYWLAAWLDMCSRIGKWCEHGFAFVFGWSPPLAAWLLSPWLWFFHFFLIGGRDFQNLDREAAKSIDNPEDLAHALWKMEAYAQTRPWTEPWIFAHMCMVSPLTSNRGGMNLARVQPSVKNRIKNLTGRYPL